MFWPAVVWKFWTVGSRAFVAGAEPAEGMLPRLCPGVGEAAIAQYPNTMRRAITRSPLMSSTATDMTAQAVALEGFRPSERSPS